MSNDVLDAKALQELKRKTGKAKDTPVRPKDAASLILVRDTARGHEVLMGRRKQTAKFMPGFYVFPGGTLEQCDTKAQPATDLKSGSEQYMAVAGKTSRARALAMAAVRETFEETGLAVAEPGEVNDTSCECYAELAARGVAPSLARLSYLGRALTPTYSPMRFHARFFIADGATHEGTLGGDGELEEIGWIAMETACSNPMADVTAFMLRHARAVYTDGGVSNVLGKPFFTARNKVRRVRYFGGPAPAE